MLEAREGARDRWTPIRRSIVSVFGAADSELYGPLFDDTTISRVWNLIAHGVKDAGSNPVRGTTLRMGYIYVGR